MGVTGAVSRIPITVRVVPAPSSGEEVDGEQPSPQQQGEAEEAGPQHQQQQQNSQSHGEEEEGQRGNPPIRKQLIQ